jgi:carboxymethylenebutenolidase
MIETEIAIQTPDGSAGGFLYQPNADDRWPGVLFLTDIGGIRAASCGMAKRLASQGYAVLLPNVFYRTAKPPVLEFPLKMGDPRTTQRLSELSGPLTPAAIERDAAAYVDFLSRQSFVNPGPMGVVGYCFTGAMALRSSAARPDRIAAAASFHGGRLFTDALDSPHTVLPRVKARLYFAHAVQDKSMPAEAIEKFEQALKLWGGAYESETYDGAYHSWTVPDSPVYSQPQAERAFAKLLGLFNATLK